MGLNTYTASGFINLGVLAVVILTAVLASGATYGFVTYQQVLSENERLSNQVMDDQYAAVSTADILSNYATDTPASSAVNETTDVEENDDVTESQDTQQNTATPNQPATRSSTPPQPITPQPNTDTRDRSNETGEDDEMANHREDEVTPIKIENVKIEAGTTSAIITWETTEPADSMFIIRGREHLSDRKLDTEHEVTVTELYPETTYNYEIIAWREGVSLYSGRREVIASWRDPEVVVVDYFTTQEEERVFVTRYIDLEVNDDGECTVIEIADTKGEPLVDARVELDGVYEDTENDYRYAANAITRTTNQNGIVRYCRPVTELKITDLTTGEVYQEKTPTYPRSTSTF